MHPCSFQDSSIFNTLAPEVSGLSCVVWNICGISSKLEDPDTQHFLFKHDIVVLLETMKDTQYDILIPTHKFHHFARKTQHERAARASGGIGIFINKTICFGVKVFSNHELLAWIKLDSKSFNRKKDLYIGCAYIPPEGSTYKAAGGNYFDIMEVEIVKYLATSDVLICGDLNARTACNNDLPTMIAGTDRAGTQNKYLDTYMNGIFSNDNIILARCSQDKVRPNRHGKELLQLCKAGNLVICNGRFDKDKDIYLFYVSW